MANVTASMTAQNSFVQTPSSGVLSGVPAAIPLTLSVGLQNGTTTDKIDLIAVKAFSFTGTTPQTIDLRSMLDIYGTAVVFARIKLFALRLESTTDAVTVTLSPNASNGWSTGFIAASSSIVLQPSTSTNTNGGFFIVSAPNTTGYAVDATHKSLDFTPSATCTATLIVAGCSA